MDLADSEQLVIYVGYGLVFLATFIFARMLLKEGEVRAAQENLEAGSKEPSNGLVKITRPFFTQYVMPIVRGKPYWDKKRKKYRRKIVAAGLKDELTPDEFISFKLFLILFFPIVGGILNAMDLLDLDLKTLVGSAAAGWFYPDLWVRQRLQARQKKILVSMPFVVDLLALSMEAGLDFIGAIGKVVEKSQPGPLVEELAQLLKEIKVGSSRQEALREMSLRIDMTEMNSFVAILISADQMGASIGKILRAQSEAIRGERMLRAEKEGAKAGQKILIPLMFIVFAVFVMVIGPFVLSFRYPNGVP